MSCKLSQHWNYFIADWVNAERIFAFAQPAIKSWQFFHGHLTKCSSSAERFLSLSESMWIDFITDWVNTETILSLTESTRKLFYSWSSQQRNFPETSFTRPALRASSQSVWARSYASRSCLQPSSDSQLIFIIWATSYMQNQIVILSSKPTVSELLKKPTMQRNDTKNLKQISQKGVARQQSQIPHACVWDWFKYSHNWSAYSAAGNMWTGNI